MKLALFADVHLDSAFAWAPPAAARRRRQAVRDALARLVKTIQDERVDAVLCAGDLYEHERFRPDTGNFLHGLFASLDPVRVFVAPGNHDWLGPASIYERVQWPPNVHIFRTDRLEAQRLGEEVTLWGAAHLRPAGTPGFLEGFRVRGPGLHVALFHGSERGWLAAQGEDKAPHAPFHADQIAEAGLAHAFVGHYHNPRDHDLYTYPGNPEPLTFGEEGDRGLVIAEFGPGGRIERRRITVGSGEVADLSIDVTGAATVDEVRERIRRALAGRKGVARVTLSGEVEPEVTLHAAALEDAAQELDAVVVRIAGVRARYDIDAICSEPTVRGAFVRRVLGRKDLDEEMRRRVLETGLRALDGRDDLEVE